MTDQEARLKATSVAPASSSSTPENASPNDNSARLFDDRKYPKYGDHLGYVVLTWNEAMGWQPDWDGRLHRNADPARRELQEASEGGIVCILAELRYTPGSEAFPRNINHRRDPAHTEWIASQSGSSARAES